MNKWIYLENGMDHSEGIYLCAGTKGSREEEIEQEDATWCVPQQDVGPGGERRGREQASGWRGGWPLAEMEAILVAVQDRVI